SNIKRLFPVSDAAETHLAIIETDQIECKKSHNLPMKTIAAFANNKGGYFVLGVENDTWKIIGLPDKKYQKFDFKKLNQNIRSQLGIGLDVTRKILKFNGKAVAIYYVEAAHTKPVIFTKSIDDVAEGHVYYRYPGEDRLISPSDLQKLIEDRLRHLSETILSKHIERLFRIGPENAAILDLSSGEVEGKGGNFVIDENLLKQLSFVKEGEFNETHGSPTLKLIGHLSPSNTPAVIGSRLANIRDEDLIEAFLRQENVTHPEAYFKRLKYTQRKWLPVYYFMSRADVSIEQIVGYLEEAGDGRAASVKMQKHRLECDISPKEVGSKRGFEDELGSLMASVEFDWAKTDIHVARRILYAFRFLKRGDVEKEYLLSLLNIFYDTFYAEASANDQSLFIAAVATVDHLLFR
ncbi:MAG: ATP-binding protein, partial [Kordiimonadaceae bacterium]|nr:ATP-binding protein [Kordiimonadaceae bacterium]